MRKRIYFILFSFLAIILSISGKINSAVPSAFICNYTGAIAKGTDHNAPDKIPGLVKGGSKRFRHIIRSKALDDTHAVDLAHTYTLPCSISYITKQVYSSYKQSAYNTHTSEHDLRGPPPVSCVS